MNILFVYTLSDSPPPPAKPLRSWTQIQMGISYISSLLIKAGHSTQLLVSRRGRFEEDVDKILSIQIPDLVCFTSVATEYPFVEQVAKCFRKKCLNVYMIIGGPHASLNPDEVLKGPFDAVCVGEGEIPTVELADVLSKSPKGILNFWIKQQNQIEKNKTRELIEDLDELPFPDRDMWKPWMEPNTRHTILIGRGCPHSCTYCCNHALRNLAQGKYVRLRSQASVMEEVHDLCEKFPDISEIFFEVETLTVKQEWGIELCNLLESFNASRNKPLAFGTNIRVVRNKSFKELFTALARAGFAYVNIGIESGSERVRKDILKRNHSNEDIIRIFDEAHEAGLKAYAYNMIGIPGETIDDFWQTVKINRRCLPEHNMLSIFYPYPGTELHKVCIERGLNISAEEDSAERCRSVLGLPEFPDKKVNHMFVWFDWYVYRGKRPLPKILSYAALRMLERYPFLLRGYRLLTSAGPLAALKQRLK